MKKGSKVQFKHSTLVGVVVERKIVNDEVKLLVDYIDTDGVMQQRWTDENEVTEIKGDE